MWDASTAAFNPFLHPFSFVHDSPNPAGRLPVPPSPPPPSHPRGTKWPREGPAARPPPSCARRLRGLPAPSASGEAGRPPGGGYRGCEGGTGAAHGLWSQACCRHCAAVARCSGA